MREILFRGKRIDNGEWVYGCYYHCIGTAYGATFIVVNDFGFIEVIPHTIGQYTGKTDKNGEKIFQGDKVLSKYGTMGIVEWDNEESAFLVNIGDDWMTMTDSEWQAIGNIYDNSELLEVNK